MGENHIGRYCAYGAKCGFYFIIYGATDREFLHSPGFGSTVGFAGDLATAISHGLLSRLHHAAFGFHTDRIPFTRKYFRQPDRSPIRFGE